MVYRTYTGDPVYEVGASLFTLGARTTVKQSNSNSPRDWNPWPPEGEELVHGSAAAEAAETARPVGTFLHIPCRASKREGLLRSPSKEFHIKRMGQGSAGRDQPFIRGDQTNFCCSTEYEKSLF